MFKKRPFFITFEGIEGSGKSYQSYKLFQKLKKENIPVIHTREPGGTLGAEKIRKIILTDYFKSKKKEEFNKYTDTLLYLAARNEHIQNKIKPALKRNNVIICDRFIDSTIAYQVFGKGVNKKLVDYIHKYVLDKIKPNLTILLKVNISKAMQRLNNRKTKNRYDKFTRNFYNKVQNSFIRISKSNKKRYFILDNSKDSTETEKIIFNKFIDVFKK